MTDSSLNMGDEQVQAEVEEIPFTVAERLEIDRRLAQHEAHPERAIPWEEVEAQALARLSR